MSNRPVDAFLRSNRDYTQGGKYLAFTRYVFVYSGIVHWSILFLAFNTSFIATAPPLIVAINIAQDVCFFCIPVVSSNVQIDHGNVVSRPSKYAIMKLDQRRRSCSLSRARVNGVLIRVEG